MDAHSSSLLLFPCTTLESRISSSNKDKCSADAHLPQFISFFELVSFSTNLSPASLSLSLLENKRINDNNNKKKRKKGTVEK